MKRWAAGEWITFYRCNAKMICQAMQSAAASESLIVRERDDVVAAYRRAVAILSIAGQTSPVYDHNGNLTTDQSGRTYT